MNALRPTRPLLGLVLLLALVIAFAVVPRALHLAWGAPVALTVLAVAVVAALWLGGVYWSRIDEAAKEAQKTAYFWGGSFGGAIGALLVFWLCVPSGSAAYHWLTGALPHMPLMVLGVGVVLIVQTVGFLLGWAIWWGAKR
jgi:hypothetical protein